jgi:hypothetical protein
MLCLWQEETTMTNTEWAKLRREAGIKEETIGNKHTNAQGKIVSVTPSDELEDE